MLDVFIRVFISFFLLLIIVRILGNKQVSHLTFFNYVTGIAFGSIAATFILDTRVSILKGVMSLIFWAVLAKLIGFITLKSPKARVLMDGEPSIVIKKGKVMEKSLAKMKINIDDLSMMLRNKDVFAMSDVDYAVFEPDGKLSVLKKPEVQNVVRKDMNITAQAPTFLPSELISDGKYVKRNFDELNIDREWIENQLKAAGIYNVKDVFYAEIQEDGSLYIIKKVRDKE